MPHQARPLPSTRDFIHIALKSFGHTGTLFPSSSYAAETIVQSIPTEARSVVEYGSGSGVLTEYILQSGSTDRKVVGIEIVEEFVEELACIQDERFILVHDDVLEASRGLRELFPEGVDAIVAGIPFSFLKPDQRELLVARTHAALRSGGTFVLYQNSPFMMKTLRRHFKTVALSVEFRNLPPYFIMVARKD